jgi:hypothetical protein
VALAQEKSKTMPVIIFCNDPLALQNELNGADIFVDGDVGEQLAIL